MFMSWDNSPSISLEDFLFSKNFEVKQVKENVEFCFEPGNKFY